MARKTIVVAAGLTVLITTVLNVKDGICEYTGLGILCIVSSVACFLVQAMLNFTTVLGLFGIDPKRLFRAKRPGLHDWLFWSPNIPFNRTPVAIENKYWKDAKKRHEGPSTPSPFIEVLKLEEKHCCLVVCQGGELKKYSWGETLPLGRTWNIFQPHIRLNLNWKGKVDFGDESLAEKGIIHAAVDTQDSKGTILYVTQQDNSGIFEANLSGFESGSKKVALNRVHFPGLDQKASYCGLCVETVRSKRVLFCCNADAKDLGVWAWDIDTRKTLFVLRSSESVPFVPIYCACSTEISQRSDRPRQFLVISDWVHHKILVFDLLLSDQPDSSCHVQTISYDEDFGFVNRPRNSVFDKFGNIFVADSANYRILVLRKLGEREALEIGQPGQVFKLDYQGMLHLRQTQVYPTAEKTVELEDTSRTRSVAVLFSKESAIPLIVTGVTGRRFGGRIFYFSKT